MFDRQSSEIGKIRKLKEWRERYSQEEYPSKVATNLFYDLYPTGFVWRKITKNIEGVRHDFKPFSLDQIYNTLNDTRREYQLSEVRKNLERWMDYGGEPTSHISGVSYDYKFKKLIKEARNGDNDAVVEIEYRYWYYMQLQEATMFWLALLASGVRPEKAIELLNLSILSKQDLNPNFDTFFDTMNTIGKCFHDVSGPKDSKGKSIQFLDIEAFNESYPSSFEILPPLFEDEYQLEKIKGKLIDDKEIDYDARKIIVFTLIVALMYWVFFFFSALSK